MGPVGWVRTPTLYIPPLNTGVVNEKDMAPAGTVVSLPPLFCSTRPVPVRPVIMPVTLNELVAHTTETGTSAPPTIAGAAGVTAQVWLGLVGCVATVTWYVEPLCTFVGMLNVLDAATGTVSAPLFRTRPAPARPDTVTRRL